MYNLEKTVDKVTNDNHEEKDSNKMYSTPAQDSIKKEISDIQVKLQCKLLVKNSGLDVGDSTKEINLLKVDLKNKQKYLQRLQNNVTRQKKT